MDDVRQLSALLNNDCDNLNILMSLNKNPQWNPVINFLSTTELNSSKKVATLRKVLNVFKDCDDEASMKRRYLQFRVQRAAEHTKPDIAKLRNARIKLQEQLLELENNNHDLHERLIHLNCANDALKRVENHNEEFDNITEGASIALKHCSFLPDSYLERETLSDIASVKNLVTQMLPSINQGTLKFSDLNFNLPKTFTTLKAIKGAISELGYMMEKIPNAEVIVPKGFQTNSIYNLQKVTIEFAKVIQLLKLGRKEDALKKLNSLTKPVNDHFDCIEGSILDLTRISQLSADYQILNSTVNTISNKLVDSIVSLLGTSSLLQSKMTHFKNHTKLSVEQKIRNSLIMETLGRETPIMEDRSPNHKPLIDFQNSILLSKLPEIRIDAQLEKLVSNENNILQAAEKMKNDLDGTIQEFQNYASIIRKECLAIETIESSKFKSIIS